MFHARKPTVRPRSKLDDAIEITHALEEEDSAPVRGGGLRGLVQLRSLSRRKPALEVAWLAEGALEWPLRIVQGHQRCHWQAQRGLLTVTWERERAAGAEPRERGARALFSPRFASEGPARTSAAKEARKEARSDLGDGPRRPNCRRDSAS